MFLEDYEHFLSCGLCGLGCLATTDNQDVRDK